MTQGCHRLIVPSEVNNIPSDLIEPCPDLPLLTGTTGEVMAPWIIKTVYQYKDCQSRHLGLIESIKIK